VCQITGKRRASEEKSLGWGRELGEKRKRLISGLGVHPGKIDGTTKKSWGGSRLEASEGKSAFPGEKVRE
jgi:hypothetical protein